MLDTESVLKNENGAEFITFCLDQIDKGQSVQTIWHDWQEKVSQSEKVS